MNNGQRVKTPTPGPDSVKVAVRVRPFSQVSETCHVALVRMGL